MNSFGTLFHDNIFFPDNSLTVNNIPDISLTCSKFPDISRFSRQVATLRLLSVFIVHYGVKFTKNTECFILQGKVAILIKQGGLSVN